jgi:hypothetical protein
MAEMCGYVRRLFRLARGGIQVVHELGRTRKETSSAAEASRLRGELSRAEAQRDAALRAVLRSSHTAVGHLAHRWTRFTFRHHWAQPWISRPARVFAHTPTLRWSAGPPINPLFDKRWYREQYPDAPQGRWAASRQYWRLAVAKGRDPDPRFDSDRSPAQSPDVRCSRWRPIDHPLCFGWRDGRDRRPRFDGFKHSRQHPDAVRQAGNPLIRSMRASNADERVQPR